MSNYETQAMYVVVIILSVFFAFKSQKNFSYEKVVVTKIRTLPFFLSFFFPWFVMCFTNIGSDYSNYYFIINRLLWDNYASFSSEEPGVNILFLLLRSVVGGDVDITIFLVKSISIVLIFISILIAKDYIKIGYSVTAYLLLEWLPSFYLITIALAASIVQLAVALYFFRDKKILPFMLVLLAAQFHNSAYIFIPIFLACIFTATMNYSNLKRFFFTAIYVMIIGLAGSIFNWAQTYLPWFHYSGYSNNSFSGSGIMIFVIYVPLFFIVYKLMNITCNEKISNCIYIFALSECLFYILSYRFRVIERMEYFLFPLYTLLIPYIFRETSIDRPNPRKKTVINSYALLTIIYLLFRGYQVFIDRTTIESGVGFYHFFNPFIE